MASKGFVTLALAFFGVDPLPKVDLFFSRSNPKAVKIWNFQLYSELDIDYFEAGLDWVLARNEVWKDKGIGVFGISQVCLFHRVQG